MTYSSHGCECIFLQFPHPNHAFHILEDYLMIEEKVDIKMRKTSIKVAFIAYKTTLILYVQNELYILYI